MKGHNELPPMIFNGTELAKQLVYQKETTGFLSVYEAVGNPSKMLHNKPKCLCEMSMNDTSWNAGELR
jgi:hypothetical protein